MKYKVLFLVVAVTLLMAASAEARRMRCGCSMGGGSSRSYGYSRGNYETHWTLNAPPRVIWRDSETPLKFDGDLSIGKPKAKAPAKRRMVRKPERKTIIQHGELTEENKIKAEQKPEVTPEGPQPIIPE